MADKPPLRNRYKFIRYMRKNSLVFAVTLIGLNFNSETVLEKYKILEA